MVKFEKNNVTLLLGDVRELIRAFPDSSFGAIITDSRDDEWQENEKW